MPLYEFVCHSCESSFEELLFNSNPAVQINCPRCGGQEVRKKISSFASRVAGGNSFSMGASSAASCNTGGT